MPKHILSQRRQALEDRFFQEQEAKQMSQLRDALATKKDRQQLGAASGIEDGKLLDALVHLHVGAGDLCALSLIPLVRVGWADGSMSDKEKAAILEAAHKQGVVEGSHGHELLEAWLTRAPGAELYGAWAAYVESLLANMEEDERTTLKESIVGLAHDVASAAGGILGIASISASEKTALEAITSAFE